MPNQKVPDNERWKRVTKKDVIFGLLESDLHATVKELVRKAHLKGFSVDENYVYNLRSEYRKSLSPAPTPLSQEEGNDYITLAKILRRVGKAKVIEFAHAIG